MDGSCHTYKSVMLYVNDSCNTYEWVVSHTCMSHVTHMNGPCHTYSSYEWVTSHTWTSHVAHTNESRHTWMCPWDLQPNFGWRSPGEIRVVALPVAMSHTWMIHVIHMNASLLLSMSLFTFVPLRHYPKNASCVCVCVCVCVRARARVCMCVLVIDLLANHREA